MKPIYIILIVIVLVLILVYYNKQTTEVAKGGMNDAVNNFVEEPITTTISKTYSVANITSGACKRRYSGSWTQTGIKISTFGIPRKIGTCTYNK